MESTKSEIAKHKEFLAARELKVEKVTGFDVPVATEKVRLGPGGAESLLTIVVDIVESHDEFVKLLSHPRNVILVSNHGCVGLPEVLEVPIGPVKEQMVSAIVVDWVTHFKSPKEGYQVHPCILILCCFVALRAVVGIYRGPNLHVKLHTVFHGVVSLLSFESFNGVELLGVAKLDGNS